jgi:hypothetical protein
MKDPQKDPQNIKYPRQNNFSLLVHPVLLPLYYHPAHCHHRAVWLNSRWL